MAEIKSLAELRARGRLEAKDRVIFIFSDETFSYSVHIDHLSYGNNEEIFRKLKLRKNQFCSQYYGYLVDTGAWPSCVEGDYPALYRVVEALYILIEGDSKISLTQEKIMSSTLLAKFKALLLKEPEKTFTKLGITNDKSELTAEGKELYEQWRWDKDKEAFAEDVAKPMLAEVELEKKKK